MRSLGAGFGSAGGGSVVYCGKWIGASIPNEVGHRAVYARAKLFGIRSKLQGNGGVEMIMRGNLMKKVLMGVLLAVGVTAFCGCVHTDGEKESMDAVSGTENIQTETAEVQSSKAQGEVPETENQETEVETESQEVKSQEMEGSKVIEWNSEWKYAANSAIHSGSATLYYAAADISKDITVCVNAGHGTSGGSSAYTLCHPDGSPKVTGGSTGEGQTKATAVAGGTTMNDGTSEAQVTLKLAKILKEKLLEEGYHVLMIRESDDVQLDNIARTVMANENADCHIALHYDSTQSDKGAFYIGVPDISTYRNMEPVASHWQEHNQLGESLIEGMRQQGVKIFGEGSMALDLTQTSYSTVPSVDLEVGDCASDYSEGTLEELADGIVAGLGTYF